MDVQGCRLPARKTPQTLPCSSQAPLRPRQTFPAAPTSPWGPGSVLLLPFASPQNSPNPPLQLPGATQAAADLSCSSNKSLRPWQCPFKDVQGCRLPARKTRQTLPCSSQAPLRPRQTFPAARATQAIAPSVHRPGATQATAISVHFPRATHATAISVSTAFQNATGRGRPFLQL